MGCQTSSTSVDFSADGIGIVTSLEGTVHCTLLPSECSLLLRLTCRSKFEEVSFLSSTRGCSEQLLETGWESTALKLVLCNNLPLALHSVNMQSCHCPQVQERTFISTIFTWLWRFLYCYSKQQQLLKRGFLGLTFHVLTVVEISSAFPASSLCYLQLGVSVPQVSANT